MRPSFVIAVLLTTLMREALLQTTPASVDPNQISLIVPQSVDDCYKAFMETQLSEQAAQVACLQELLWGFQPAVNFSVSDSSFFRDLFGSDFTTVVLDALPPSGYRVRREARTMSSGEWQRFRDALDTLYRDGTIRRFAELYAQAVKSHSGGPSFLPWNRIFLLMFEEALRKVDRHVFLPYWDSSMDEAMRAPVNSIVWKPEYFGTGTGDVKTGLGAGWVTDQGYLQRNYGQDGRLISKANIREITRLCHLESISKPTASPRHDIERLDGGPLVWVGGDMAHPATAGFDPLFYMHKAYTDYTWELFRVRQANNCSVSPTSDYPDLPPGSTHQLEAPMFGFDWLTNQNGLQGNWIESWYSYEIHPTCPDCCPSCIEPEPMYCDTAKKVCVSRSRRSFPLSVRDTATPTKEQFFEPAELLALSSVTPPRNRGIQFDHNPSDGRTLDTAIFDTVGEKSTRVLSNTVPNSRSRLTPQNSPAFARQSTSSSARRRTASPDTRRSSSSARRAGQRLRSSTRDRSPPVAQLDRNIRRTNQRNPSNRFSTAGQSTSRRDRRRQSDRFPAPIGDAPGFTRQNVRRVGSMSPDVFVNGLQSSGDRLRSGTGRLAVAPNGRVFERQESRRDRPMLRTDTWHIGEPDRQTGRRSDIRRETRRPDGLQTAGRPEQTSGSTRRARTRPILPRSWDVSQGINNVRSISSQVRTDSRPESRRSPRTQRRREMIARQQTAERGSLRRDFIQSTESRSFVPVSESRSFDPRFATQQVGPRSAISGIESRDFIPNSRAIGFSQQSGSRGFVRSEASRDFRTELSANRQDADQRSSSGNFFRHQLQDSTSLLRGPVSSGTQIPGSRGFVPRSAAGSFASGSPQGPSFVPNVDRSSFIPNTGTGFVPNSPSPASVPGASLSRELASRFSQRNFVPNTRSFVQSPDPRSFAPSSGPNGFIEGTSGSNAMFPRTDTRGHIPAVGSRDFVPQPGSTGLVISGNGGVVPRTVQTGFIPNNLGTVELSRSAGGMGTGSLRRMSPPTQIPYAPEPVLPHVVKTFSRS